MHPGTEMDYRMRIRGIPVRWRSRITVWDPPRRFVDEQVRGPYRRWIHEHRFIEDAGGTCREDNVQYALPGGALIQKLFAERDLRKIFSYRSARLREIFGVGPTEPELRVKGDPPR
jgi:ligand-binding SRPBCC domain-containing protein